MAKRAFGMVMVSLMAAMIVTSASGQPLSDADTIRAAVSLLPRKPNVEIVAIDANRDVAPGIRDTVRALDAFIVRGHPRIYVNTASLLFRYARSLEFYRHALAAVIWHEVAHVRGAGEGRARWEEQQLWTTFLRDDRVHLAAGLRYLALIQRREGVHP